MPLNECSLDILFTFLLTLGFTPYFFWFTLAHNYKLICDCQLLFDFSAANDHFKFLTKYLATFSGEDAYTLSEAKEEAAHAVVEFVKAPNMFKVFWWLL